VTLYACPVAGLTEVSHELCRAFWHHAPILFSHSKQLNLLHLQMQHQSRLLMIIRLFLKNKEFADKSLVEIFGHLFNFVPVAHRANADVKMLIAIFRKLNITEEKILNIL
jgi:hypothetical protein